MNADGDVEMALLPAGSATSEQRRREPAAVCRECITFIDDSSSDDSDGRCQCTHRDTNPPHINIAVDTEWTSDAFGRVRIEGGQPKRFLRLASDTEPSDVYNLMTRRGDDGWGWPKPSMVVSVLGGGEVKDWVQKVIRQGLDKALNDKTDTFSWILTEGFDEGTGRFVGEAAKDSEEVYAVGITPWGFVHNREKLVVQGGVVDYSVKNTTSESCCLEKNHDGFLLVDDGSEGRKGGEKNFSVKLEEHISTQHIEDISVLNMLISGETTMLERVGMSLKNSTPWLVLAGSGGVADLLRDILEDQSPASDDVARVRERIRELKPSPSEAQTDQLVEQVQSICQRRDLITFYHEEQRPEDFDTVMFKALIPDSKLRAKELRLAMRWNFASSDDIKDINIDWRGEAEKECMTLALISDNLQFVRLFIEKQFDMEEYLTYGVLEKLYSSVAKDTLIYNELLKCLKKKKRTSDSLEEISLFEVSGVLKKFMGEEFFSPQRFLLDRGTSYKTMVCESPWIDLFIWAVLQNYSDMAVFFWEKQAEDSVLNALSACKMLGKMSTLEKRTDLELSMNQLAQKFEDRAHGMLNSCIQNNHSHSFELLNRESPVWNTNCFKMGIAVESHLFFDHDGLEPLLSQAWRGDMKKDTALWKVFLTIILWPLLLWTPFISYREPDTSTEPKPSRWRQFWYAPVTTFAWNAVMYLLFLILFAFVLLVDFKPPPSGPSISECVLYFWVITFCCEEIYELFFMCDRGQRMKLYWQDRWNWLDFIALLLFFTGLFCRMFERSYYVGRGFLCIDYMVFTIRLIHTFTVYKQMGPKIIIVVRMMKDVFSFLTFLGVWIVAYGVASQALLYSYDPNPYRILRRVFWRPYLYIFGHIPVEEIDVGHWHPWPLANNCTDNMTQIAAGAEPCRIEFNNPLVILLLFLFLLVTNIMLINLVIAMLTSTYDAVQEKSDHHWKFQQYKLITEYQFRPALAPPLIIFSHLCLFFSFLKKSSFSFLKKSSSTPNTDQTQEEKKKVEERTRTVKDWESTQKNVFLDAQRETVSDPERIKQISVKVDRMEKQFDQRQRALETKMDLILEALAKASWTKPPST